MLNNFFFSFLFVFCVFAQEQNTYTIDVHWDGTSNPLEITQEITWKNSSKVSLDEIILLDWNHAYSSEHSPLGKFLANEYDYKLIRASKQKRGYTNIASIRHDGKNMGWSRLPKSVDVIAVSLPKKIAPNKTFSFEIRYSVQLPDATIFKFGKSKDEIHVNHWHLLLASQQEDGTWEHQSNLGFGTPRTPVAKLKYSFSLPNEVSVVLPIANAESLSPLLITNKDTYLSIPFGQSELITDMLPKDIKQEDLLTVTKSISSYLKTIFRFDDTQKYWALQKDYSQKPLLLLESLPQFLGVFEKSQVFELKLLMTLLEQCSQKKFGKQDDVSAWLLEGLPHYLWQKYVSQKYPDLKIAGSLNTWPILKKYHFIKAPYYRSWEVAVNVTANNNRGQSLITPANQLTRYNRRVANPLKTGLALLYLESYLGENSVLEAVKKLPKNNRLNQLLEQELLRNTEKPTAWFFQNYIAQNNNGDLSVSANKISADLYEVSVKSTKENSVIPMTLISNNDTQNTHWIDNNELPYVKVFDKNETKSITLNQKHFITEQSLNNNSYSFNKRFFKSNLRLRLFQDIPKSGTSILLLTPEFGYNIYDGLLAGITVGNSSLLNNKFQFKLSPLFGAKSNKTTGFGYAVGNLFHEDKAHYLTRFTLFGSSFHYESNKRYTTFTPSVQLYFRPKGIQQKDRSSFLLRHVSVGLQDLPEDDDRRSYGVSLATFQSKSGSALQNLFYKTELQIAKSFKKLSVESEFIKYYAPNKRFVARVFAGSFLQNNSRDAYFDFNISRVNDYLFQYDLYGRSESEGFFSQQYIKADGALRTTGMVIGANKGLITAQTSITFWRWIEGYAEVGWIKNNNQKAHTHWGTGVSFNLVPDFFELHFPLYDATGNLMTKNAYPKQLRFQLSLRPAALVKLFSRSWL